MLKSSMQGVAEKQLMSKTSYERMLLENSTGFEFQTGSSLSHSKSGHADSS